MNVLLLRVFSLCRVDGMRVLVVCSYRMFGGVVKFVEWYFGKTCSTPLLENVWKLDGEGGDKSHEVGVFWEFYMV